MISGCFGVANLDGMQHKKIYADVHRPINRISGSGSQ